MLMHLKEHAMRLMASMKARVIAGPQKVGSKTVSRRLITLNELETQLVNARSSWVDYFEYDEKTLVFSMKTKTSDIIYTWEGVDPKTAYKALNGLEHCRKTDTRKNKPKRWWPGKTPSFGAAFWYILKPFVATQAKARAQEMRDYMFVSGEMMGLPGAPTKEMKRYKQFGRLWYEEKMKDKQKRGIKI